ncbi:uncharacterized protein LOC127871355 [Dreissena polymorpha]|uniref:Uncharacterized protein n=1 Tax=Dreissena polymorpha TaxID=45954 RepID=A0A9D4R7M7_DREPO|nr:uncharacterized protein LOC127871355 [Dreissena polymorpha]KAH3857263.1 hypothetical protein DPMN_099869 [Dreissena polymorpha]
MFALLIGFAIFEVSCSVALPGANEYYGSAEDDDDVLPPQFSRHGALSAAIGTTESPLEKLLDKLYGNGGWRSLLTEFTEQNIPTTYLPDVKATELPHSANGFYGVEISGQAFNRQAKPSTPKPQPPARPLPAAHTGFSKTFNKIIGSQQHTVDIHANSRVEKPDVNPLPVGSGAANMFLQEQARAQTQAVAAVAEIPPTLETNGGKQNSHSSQHGEPQIPTQTQNFEMAAQVFDPNVVNSQQNAFSPNEAFKGFVTQTGSEPHGRGGNLNFNPDKVNQMKDPDNSLAGSVSQTPQGTSGGYRFNAYEDAERPSFDATALNQALMTFNKPNIQPEAFFPNYRSNFVSAKAQAAQTSDKGVTHAPDANTTPKKAASTKATEAPSIQRNPSGMFVPGSLYSGGGGQNNFFVDQQSGIGQIAGSPVFLRTMPMGNQAFDPNLLNSGQSNFNPNAQSWIRTRRETTKETDDNGNGLTTFPTTAASQITVSPSVSPEAMTLQSTTNTASVTATTEKPITTTTITLNFTSHFTTPATVISGKASESTTTVATAAPVRGQSGFDPNELNAQQGQSSFIPGRLTSGAVSENAFGQSPVESSSNGGFNPNQASFGSNTSNMGSGNGGFDPNSMFNMMSKAMGNGSTSENGSSGSSFGIGLGTNSGFDPNSANTGFGSVGSGNYFGLTQNGNDSGSGALSGYNPYGSSGGFGANTFGNAAAGSAGGDLYSSAFDPNKANQMAMSNPYVPDNDSDISQMIGYFLGGSSGGSGGENSGSGNSQSAYGSAFIGAFNPDTVNKMTFDPDAFNKAHLNFDPLEMLMSNPGMDKATLMAVGAKFDPDKINSAYSQQSFSPIDMLGRNPGMDKNVLSNLKYDPNDSGTMNNSGVNGATSYNSGQQGASFDPVDLMSRLMQGASAFYPGTSGAQQQNRDPSGMLSLPGGNPSGGGNVGTGGNSFTPAPVLTSSSGKPVSKTHLMISSTSALTSPTPALTLSTPALTSSTQAALTSKLATIDPAMSTTTQVL